MLNPVLVWLEANQGWTTTLANIVTIGGVLAIFNAVRAISISLAVSASVSARLLTAQIETAKEALVDSALPPGDESRIHYEAYRASKRWADPYYSGNFSAEALRSFTAEQWHSYNRHLAVGLRLLDWVLRSSPAEARDAWKAHMASHVLDHGRALRRLRWRLMALNYSKPMRDLLTLARRRAA